MGLERNEQQNPTPSPGPVLSCLLCGSAIKPGRKFCSHCGAPAGATPHRAPAGFARQLSICPQCGFENHHSDRFCKTCGGLLAAAPTRRLNHEVAETSRATPLAEERRPDPIIRALPPTQVELTGSSREIEAATGLAAGSMVEPNGAEAAGRPSDSHLDAPVVLNRGDSAPASTAEPATEAPERPADMPVVLAGSSDVEDRGLSFLRPRNLGFGAVAALLIAGVVVLYRYHPTASGVKAPSLSSSTLAATPSSPPFVAVRANAPAPAEITSKPPRPTGKAVAPAGKISTTHKPPQGDAKLAEAIPSSGGNVKAPLSDLGPNVAAPQAASPPATAAPVSPAPSSNPDAVANAAAVSKQSEPAVPTTIAAKLATSIPMPAEASPAKSAPAVSSVPLTAAPPAQPNVHSLRVGGNVQSWKILSRTPPTYPAAARVAGIQGTVHLEALIAKDGTVRDLKVISGNQMLAGAALDAVRHWRYRPTELNGEPIEVSTEIDVDFRIH